MIAFDAFTATGETTGTSKTFSHTVGSGANRILWVGIRAKSAGSDDVTGVTYNGVAMTRAIAQVVTGADYAYLYYLVAPASGANNVVISFSTSRAADGYASSYTGAKQTGVPDATASQAVTGISSNAKAIVTVASNCWIVTQQGNSQANTNGQTNFTARGSGGGSGFGDTNAAVAPGSLTLTWSYGGNVNDVMVAASFAPVPDSGSGAILTFI